MSTGEVQGKSDDDDGKVSDKSAKLKSILDKIRKKNAEKNGDSEGGLTLKSSGGSDGTTPKFTAFKEGEQIVGQDIVEQRFERGHCKGMMFGSIEMKLPDTIIGNKT